MDVPDDRHPHLHGVWDFVFLMLLYLAESYGISPIWSLVREPVAAAAQKPSAARRRAPVAEGGCAGSHLQRTVDMVTLTLTACTQLHYPKDKLNVFVLDDGGTTRNRRTPTRPGRPAARRRAQELKAAAAAMGVHYLTRESNVHAKAGTLTPRWAPPSTPASRADLRRTQPRPRDPDRAASSFSFWTATTSPPRIFSKHGGFFHRGRKAGLRADPHFFINPTPVEKNLGTYTESRARTNVLRRHPARAGFLERVILLRVGRLLRRRHLMAIGGLVEDTVTEDAGTALKLHAKGFNSVYLNKAMIMGLSPESFDSFIIQRSRWPRG